VKEKPIVGSPLFGEFPSDRIPKATKDGNVHFFIHSFTCRDGLMMDNPWQSKHVNYTSEFRERLEAATYELPVLNETVRTFVLISITKLQSTILYTTANLPFFIGRGFGFAVLCSDFLLPGNHAIQRNHIDIECCLAISYANLAISCTIPFFEEEEN
jgi:hypothetical protein